MKSLIIENENLNRNFWKENPYLLDMVDTFKLVYDKDSSKDKEDSSKLMWAIYLTYDYFSKYAHLGLEQRIDLVEKEYLKEPGFFEKHKKKLQPIIDLFLELQKTSDRKYLETWKATIEKRDKFLRNTEYDIKTADILDKMLLGSVKILGQRAEIEAIVNKQEDRIKGGLKQSLLEKGEIKAKE